MKKDGKTFNHLQLHSLPNEGDLQISSIIDCNMQLTQLLVLCTMLYVKRYLVSNN